MTTRPMTKTETRFYQVTTPSVFKEIELPADESAWTSAQRKRFAKLEDLAERHGTSIESTSYRRG